MHSTVYCILFSIMYHRQRRVLLREEAGFPASSLFVYSNMYNTVCIIMYSTVYSILYSILYITVCSTVYVIVTIKNVKEAGRVAFLKE